MGRKKNKKAKEGLTAKTADKHALYQLSVQDPGFEVHLASRYFKRRVGRQPLSLREDFCGTALLCGEWVRSDPARTALGVDIDPSVLEWGRQHVLAPLEDEARSRVTLVEGDVRDQHPDRFDVVMALNYSYFCFKTRDTLRGYFATVKEHLRPDGLFFLDLFGGWDAQRVLMEKRKVNEGFKYVWDQAAFDPITSHFLAHIHFQFPDGTKLKKAFTYDWRLWTIPELKELLAEAGFAHVECLWEDEDEDGNGTGTFKPQKRADNDPGWNAYLLASVDVPPKVAAKRAAKTPPTG
ncbi:MAG: class I SAM-dependent methyltransferase [Myxococcales bacterium]|nr:class I SAM-dependent methyltransferase [Myxococcales bacterium]